jgi:hypothetical protein
MLARAHHGWPARHAPPGVLRDPFAHRLRIRLAVRRQDVHTPISCSWRAGNTLPERISLLGDARRADAPGEQV